MKKNTVERIDKISNWLLVVIVAVPFLLSAQALKNLAEQNGIASAWLYPVMIDGALIIFNLVALRYSLYGQRSYYAWFLVIVATVVSVVLNVAHAPETLLARTMAGMPPLFILAAFHAVVMRIEEDAKREGAVETLEKLRERIASAKKDAEAISKRADLQFAEKKKALQEKMDLEKSARMQKVEDELQAQIEKVKKELRLQVQQLQDQKAELEREIANLQKETQNGAGRAVSEKKPHKLSDSNKPVAPATVSGTRLKQLQTLSIELRDLAEFGSADVAEALNCSTRTAYDVLKAGVNAGFLDGGQGTYHFNGVPLPA